MTVSTLPYHARRIERLHRERGILQRAVSDIRADIRAGAISAADAAPRIARLNTEIANVRADIAAAEAEAVQNGFTLPALREVLRLRRMSEDDRAEWDALMGMYREALDIPVGAPAGGRVA